MSAILGSNGHYFAADGVAPVFAKENIRELAQLVKEAKSGKTVTLSLANTEYNISAKTTPVNLALQVAYHRTKELAASLKPQEIEALAIPQGNIASIGSDIRGTGPEVGFAATMDTNLSIVALATDANKNFEKAMGPLGFGQRSGLIGR